MIQNSINACIVCLYALGSFTALGIGESFDDQRKMNCFSFGQTAEEYECKRLN